MLLSLFSRIGSALHPPATPDDPEAELLRRTESGDKAAFERFYALYYPRLFRFIYRMNGKLDPVEELIHETLLTVWEKPGNYNGTCKVSTWVFAIAYRHTLKSFARTRAAGESVDIAEAEDILADWRPSPAHEVEWQDWLSVGLNRLSADQRAVIELAFYDGLSYQEIAEILGCPPNTVKTRMFHARRKLQNLLNQTPGEEIP